MSLLYTDQKMRKSQILAIQTKAISVFTKAIMAIASDHPLLLGELHFFEASQQLKKMLFSVSRQLMQLQKYDFGVSKDIRQKLNSIFYSTIFRRAAKLYAVCLELNL